MADELFALTEADRNLLDKVAWMVLGNRGNEQVEEEPGTIHRASDIVIVNVVDEIPARESSATPAEHEVDVWDIYEDIAEDYKVPILDRPDVVILPGKYHAAIDRQGNWSIIKRTDRINWVGFLYESYSGVVMGFWVVPSFALDGKLPTGPQWVVNLYKWNFGVIGATVRVEEDPDRDRWIPLTQEYICPDDREIPPQSPPETPPTYPYPE